MLNTIINLTTKFDNQFAANGKTLQKISYFGVNPFGDDTTKTVSDGKTPGEIASNYNPAKLISIKSVDSNTAKYGRVMGSDSILVSYTNTNGQINDPKHYYKIMLPSRDTLVFDATNNQLI